MKSKRSNYQKSVARNIAEKTYFLVSLGCAKNTVDSESMAQLLDFSGYQAVEKAERAETLIVNTCGFIGPAKDESYQVLQELAAHKRKGQILIATGCLTQRYGMRVIQKVPGVDGVLGTQRWMDVVKIVNETRRSAAPTRLLGSTSRRMLDMDQEGQSVAKVQEGKYNREMFLSKAPPADQITLVEKNILRAAIQGGSAFLKIADGCRRPCAFCAIPLIKGTAVSRPLHRILEEARQLQEKGIKEINLIAQDTTDYGHDLGIKDGLAYLLEKLVEEIPDVPWLRILYAYPGYVTDHLIDVMGSHPQIIPYLDMPLQHAHPAMLHRMRRPANIDWVYKTLEKMRNSIPDLVLRSTFIVGYPGETEEEFNSLLDFLQEIRFDRVGAFQFSFEPGTSSERLGDPIPAEVKQERYEKLMALQQPISLEKNLSWVGKTLPVLIEGNGSGKDFPYGISIGRSYRDAPEIDGLVIVERQRTSFAELHPDSRHHSDSSNSLPIGEIVPVHITGAMTYDLNGVSVPYYAIQD